MASPYSLENTLRVHDEAFMKWFLGCKLDYGDIAGKVQNDVPILALIASPERAFAEVPDLLVERNWIAGTTAEAMRANADANYDILPLPVASIEIADPVPDLELAGVPKRYPYYDFDRDAKQFITHRHPSFFNTEYTVTVMGLTRFTWAFIWEWLISTLGELGKADNEVLIDVQHAEPFGLLHQRLRMLGIADMSALEGADEPRYIRKQITFELRTIFLKLPEAATYGVTENVRIATCDYDDNEYDSLDVGGEQTSMNLFHIPDKFWDAIELWPREGNATVAQYEAYVRGNGIVKFPDSLTLTGAAETDIVEIAEFELYKNALALDLLSIAFEYDATAPWRLDIFSRTFADDVLTLYDRLELPAAREAKRKKVHYFAAVDIDSIDYRVYPVSPAQEETLNILNISIRRISLMTNFAPDNIINTGSEFRYEWNAVGVKKPCLVLAKIVSTSGGTETATVEDDITAPTFTKTRQISDGVNKYLVILMQPKVSSLVLRVPLNVTLATIRALRYYGSFDGHTV